MCVSGLLANLLTHLQRKFGLVNDAFILAAFRAQQPHQLADGSDLGQEGFILGRLAGRRSHRGRLILGGGDCGRGLGGGRHER